VTFSQWCFEVDITDVNVDQRCLEAATLSRDTRDYYIAAGLQQDARPLHRDTTQKWVVINLYSNIMLNKGYTNLERKITKSGPLCGPRALNPALLDFLEVVQTHKL
jgi:hypothetical protein